MPEIHSQRIVLKLDPGSAFGTGSHPTTRLCLEAVERNPPMGLTVADIGCGSGILGIAALGFGAKEVQSVDIDSLAVRATKENALLNNWTEKELNVSQGSIDALRKQLINPSKVDLLFCNILAPTIKELAPEFSDITHLKSRLVLSGLLVDQVEDIANCLALLKWKVLYSYKLDEWAVIELCRNAQ